MVYKIKLKVRDEERWLTSIEYGYRIKFSDVAYIDKIIQLHQEVSAKLGSEEPLPLEGGLFRLRFSSTDHDQFFYDWMFVSAMEDGSIEILQNEVETVSRISFWDCYCVGIEEWMSAGGAPMGIELLLSPAIMKKDALVYEKIWKVSDIHGNTEVVKAETETKKETPKPAAPPTPLITAVTGKTSALPNTIVEYKVTSYNIPNISSSDKARIKWIVKVEDKEFPQKTQGETLKLTIDESWTGKDIVVMPYLKKYTQKVSVKTNIKVEGVILFVNGYWNSGDTAQKIVSKVSSEAGKKIKELIADNMGDTPKKGYWARNFEEKSRNYFKRKYQNWSGKAIGDVKSIFIDGSNNWRSSGETRYQAGWEEASSLIFQKELKDNQIINDSGEQIKYIFVVSHSMGAAHAEGMISYLLSKGYIVEWVLHFAPADNHDFSVNLPHATYQINIMPDPVLALKNFDDAQITNMKNIWDIIKETIGQKPETDQLKPNPFQIPNILPGHFITPCGDKSTNES